MDPRLAGGSGRVTVRRSDAKPSRAAAEAPNSVEVARDLLAELVDIPSPSGHEGRIVERICELCGEWGLPVARVRSEIGRDSLVVGARRQPGLVLAAHVDTIAAPWPAKATVDGDIVRGLGSADDKGGVVACLLAARALSERGADLTELGVAFAFPVDAERGGSGSRTIALDLRPKRAIALEATGLRPGIAETGDLDVWIHVRGRSAHGALTDQGENAIHAAVALISELPSLELERFEHSLIGASQAEVGAIRGGTEFNTVPDSCSFQLQVRIVPGQDGAATLAALEELAARHGGQVEIVEMTEPFETPADSPLVTGLIELTEKRTGQAPEPIGVPAWTDAHNFVDFAGAEAVVYGPGDFTVAHLPEEHIDVNAVVACAEIFTELAHRASGW
jgi:acetylornithine deacetylase/succinyl-diaminopimelate desuccinylase-like protein